MNLSHSKSTRWLSDKQTIGRLQSYESNLGSTIILFQWPICQWSKKRNKLTEQILHCRSELSKICPAVLVQSIRAKIQDANSKLFKHLHQIKAQKLDQLIGPQITSDSSPENLKTVVTIPENLLLSDSEKSVLSKGLNFVPISQKTDEFSVKQDVEKFLRRVQLKAFFHDKEDDSNTSNKDTFETLQIRKSKWTPPEGQFSSLDFFPQKMSPRYQQT